MFRYSQTPPVVTVMSVKQVVTTLLTSTLSVQELHECGHRCNFKFDVAGALVTGMKLPNEQQHNVQKIHLGSGKPKAWQI